MKFDSSSIKKPLILVVDDDGFQLKVSRDFLEQSGFAVECVQDGESALRQIRDSKPDLVLLDVLMPVMDGYETCVQLRRMPGGEHIPVLMTTGLDDIKSITMAYAAGATDFISKPINWLILEQRILYMLRAGSALGSLHRSEMKNRALLDAIPDVMFHIDGHGVVIDYKGAAGFSLLIEAAQAAGKKLMDVFPAVLAKKMELSMQKAFETGVPQTFEFMQTDFGNEQYYESRIVICGDFEILVIMRDITERKRFEQALRISETKYRIVAENTYDWEFWLNPDGQFVYTSPSCQNVTGYAAAEFEGDSKLFLRIVHPDDLTKCATHCFNPHRRSRKTGELEYRIMHRDGNLRWIGHVCQPVYDAEGTYLGIRGSNRDITEQKKAAALVRQEEMRRIRHEEERKRLLEKEKILKDLHDGIGGIITNVGLLAEMASNSQSQDYIFKALHTMSELSREAITELRNFMNIIDERRLDWHAFLADLRNFGSSMTEGNGLAFNIKTSVQSKSPSPESFLCLNIFRIYKEALTNVIKHANATTVNVTISVKAKSFALSVRDNGRGFTKEPGEGRGVMNMKSRAEEVGGSLQITCHSGTLIQLDLPIPIKYP
ncbi:MAG TPA: response regulator [Dissulfurispiraceae bacterium]|nr:response regulator [Dissulfurispiraceae bacterium]